MDAELGNKLLAMFKNEELQVIEDGDWISESKYEMKDTIVLFEDKYYKISECRSGSYFTDYHYEEPTVCEVSPKQKTITVWERVSA